MAHACFPAPAVSDRLGEDHFPIYGHLAPVSQLLCFTSLSLSRASACDAAGIDLDADSLTGAQRDLVEIVALGARRLGLDDRIYERPDILDQLLLREARLAHAGLHDAGLL